MDTINELISFHGGISQQDITLRLPQQVEDSVNCYHSLEYGTRRRNPTRAIGQSTGITSDCWTYEYDRGLVDSNEKYSFIYDNNGLRVIDLNTGLNIPVIDSSSGYLGPFTSKSGYSALTVKDTTFISNRNKICTMTDDVDDVSIYDNYNKCGYIWIKRSEPVEGYDYSVTIEQESGAKQTFDVTGIKTTTGVSNEFNTLFNDETYLESEASGNIVKVKSLTSDKIKSIIVSDNYGNTAISSFFKKVDTEDDLPSTIGFSDVVMEIGGSNNYDTTYWLVSENGYWKETRKPTVNYKIDNTTMPHKLTRQVGANNSVYFIFEPIEWNDRLIGDDENNEIPSFIGTGIADIFFHANRLGLLTPNSILFSEVGEFYNFWKTTQVAVLDSDKIDVDVESKKAIRLHYVEFLHNNIIVFGEKTQYKISYAGALTSATISATPIMNYDISTKTRPIAIGNKIYFIAYNGNYNSMYSIEYTDNEVIKEAENLSKHIPTLLDGTIDEIVGSSVNSIIVAKSSLYDNKLFVYKFLDNDGKLIQSSWFTWTFNAEIHSIFISGSELYLLTTRDGTVGNTNWILANGLWNDDNTFDDSELWNDNETIKYNNIEHMQLVPLALGSDFRDNNETEYDSVLTLSEYLPYAQEKVRMSDKVNLKTIYVKSSDDSIFDLSILHKNRNIERIIGQQYVIGRKPYILGKAKDVRISIASVGSSGFEVNGVAIEARINNRSRMI